MRIKASVTLNDEQVKEIMEAANLNTAEEAAALLKGIYIAEAPQYRDLIEFEVLEESEDTNES